MAMRVVLAKQYGELHTLVLPDIVEGKYYFRENSGRREILPVSIEAKNKKWFLCIEDEEAAEDTWCFDEKEIADQSLIQMFFHAEKYVLFAEKEQEKDYEFVPYYLEENTEYTIGRRPESHIYYPNEIISRDHAVLSWKDGFWNIQDCNSKNGIYVNGRRTVSARLRNGDSVYIMGLTLLIGTGFIAINNANNRVTINTHRIRKISDRTMISYPECPELKESLELFDRMPHKRFSLEREEIEIEMPPMALSASKIPLLLRMGSPMVMGGRALMSGNIAMTLTALIFPVLTQGITEKDRKEYEKKRTEVYGKYLKEKEKDIQAEKEEEEYLLNRYYPELSAALSFASTKKHLWRCQKSDPNFLEIRIGAGSRPLLADKKYNDRHFEVEPDVLTEQMYELAERPVLLENVPITFSLITDPYIGVIGEAPLIMEFCRNMIMQIVLTHSYDEVKLVLLLGLEYAADFEFVRYLPHNWNDDRSMRFFATSQSDALKISEYLNKELEDLKQRKSGVQAVLKKKAAYVVVALDKYLFDCVEIFKELLAEEQYGGISIVSAFAGIPKECSRIINLRETNTMIDLKHPEQKNQIFVLDNYDHATAAKSMQKIMRTKLKVISQAYSLPDTLTFLEMYEVGCVEHLNARKRWSDNNPVKSLFAPIGKGTDGRIFELDLHEKKQGPHGLVAGMTGSGKSEFLITYILSMAVSYSPEEVAFVLIDYKGGGLADAFADKEHGIFLPHLVGTITNLDGASIQRSLMSIKSELMRRQRVFKEAKMLTGEGTLDIYEYQKLYRNKKVEKPLPHLFIISDEFAELKQQQPDFMRELISAARIGRSLGVHLILATQKPGGVVNDQIWSNTKFRVCLRVQDRGDSMEMLKRPEAAELRHTGRFYLQVGYNEYFAMGQSAWCGADYVPKEEEVSEKNNDIQFIDHVGQVILNVKPDNVGKKAEKKQVTAIVQYLTNLAKREKLQTRNLWKEELPGQIELEALLRKTEVPQSMKNEICALVGMVDDPEFQCQYPLFLSLSQFHNMLLVGNSGSGKSTFIKTMLYSLLYRYSPAEVNYYLIDLSKGALGAYQHMPHCGVYLTQENDSDFRRFLSFLKDLIAGRKKLFEEAEVTEFDEYRRSRPLSLILVIIDGFTNIRMMSGGEELYLSFQEYLREGTSFGVRFILTVNHDNEVGSRSKLELDYRVALQAKDRFEYGNILETRCSFAPPEKAGRGMCMQEERPLEYQTAMLDCDQPEQDRSRLLREKLSRLAQRYVDFPPAERLAMVDFEQTYEEFSKGFTKERIPLGYSMKDMKQIAIPFQQLHCMSLYFGNPRGVSPVFRNLLTSARQNHMRVYIVRRKEAGEGETPHASIFDKNNLECILDEGAEAQTVFGCTEEELDHLSDTILGEIKNQNVYRDEYSVQHGIPLERKGRTRLAARYIRGKSTPVLVLIESFGDFCKVCRGEDAGNESKLEGLFRVFFQQGRGYNIYFAAGFYFDDEQKTARSRLFDLYNTEEFSLLFGGRYDKVLKPELPYEVKKMTALNPLYNRFWMKYREALYPSVMPCGKLQEETEDPDEMSIL